MTKIIPAGQSANPTLASTVLGNLNPGDQTSFIRRLAGLLPPSWFGTGATEVNSITSAPGAPVLNMVLSGVSYNLSWDYVLFAYVLKQSRLATATGVWLDRISYDFFGNNLPRRVGESDTAYRNRIFAELFRERDTRNGIIQALTDLTGNAPKIMELWNPGDCGGYDVAASLAYDKVGAWGDLSLNNQFLVTAFRASPPGVASVGGFDNPQSGFDVGGSEYVDMAWITGIITDAEIYATVARTVAAGYTAWVALFDNAKALISAQYYFGNVDDSENIATSPWYF